MSFHRSKIEQEQLVLSNLKQARERQNLEKAEPQIELEYQQSENFKDKAHVVSTYRTNEFRKQPCPSSPSLQDLQRNGRYLAWVRDHNSRQSSIEQKSQKEHYIRILDNAEAFKITLEDLIRIDFKLQRKLQAQKGSTLTDLQNKLNTIDKSQARFNCTSQMNSILCSGDRNRKHDEMKGVAKTNTEGLIALNQPTDLSSVCLQLAKEDTGALKYRGLQVVRFNTMMNKKSAVLVKKTTLVAHIFIEIEDVNGQKQVCIPVSTGIGATPKEAFKLAVDDATEMTEKWKQLKLI